MTLGACPVLLYHEVVDPAAAEMPQYNVSPAAFRRQLEQLVTQGYELVTVTELVARVRAGAMPGQLAAVTFDDGFRSFLSHALAVLEELGAAATMYVPTRWSGGPPGWIPNASGPTIMTKPEVAMLAETRVEIGGHGYSHLHLDLLKADQIRTEVEQNKSELESLIGREVTSFAYPHGSHDRRVREIVRESGFHNACAVNSAPFVLGTDAFRIGRIVVSEDTDLAIIATYQRRLQRQYPNGRTSARTAASRGVYRATRRFRLHRHHRALLETQG